MRRFVSGRRGLVPIVLGTLLIAGVAVAVAIGNARINSNQGETPQFTEPTVENIGVAVVDPVTACTDADLEYESISSTSLFKGETFDYTPPGPLGGQHRYEIRSPLHLCLGNQATAPEMTITVSSENVVSDELLGCPDPAEEAAGDPSCERGQGELTGLVVLGLPSPQADCAISDGLLIDGRHTLSLPGTIAPGSFCRFAPLGLVGSSEDATPSTDTITFDLVFTADDGT